MQPPLRPHLDPSSRTLSCPPIPHRQTVSRMLPPVGERTFWMKMEPQMSSQRTTTREKSPWNQRSHDWSTTEGVTRLFYSFMQLNPFLYFVDRYNGTAYDPCLCASSSCGQNKPNHCKLESIREMLRCSGGKEFAEQKQKAGPDRY